MSHTTTCYLEGPHVDVVPPVDEHAPDQDEHEEHGHSHGDVDRIDSAIAGRNPSRLTEPCHLDGRSSPVRSWDAPLKSRDHLP